MKKIISTLVFVAALALAAFGQDESKYSYEAQSAFIPEELGRVYLGMPFKEFAAKFDLSKSEVGDTRFGWLPAKVQHNKGPIRTVHFKVHGLTPEQIEAATKEDKVREPDGWEKRVVRLDPEKIPDAGIIYIMEIEFDPSFDLRGYALKKFGEGADFRKADDEYYFYDVQWVKKTSDGLQWLIRVFDGKEKSISLIGRIDGTEWGLDQL